MKSDLFPGGSDGKLKGRLQFPTFSRFSSIFIKFPHFFQAWKHNLIFHIFSSFPVREPWCWLPGLIAEQIYGSTFRIRFYPPRYLYELPRCWPSMMLCCSVSLVISTWPLSIPSWSATLCWFNILWMLSWKLHNWHVTWPTALYI